MAVLITLVNTMWSSLVIKRTLLTLIGLFVLNRVGLRNHWWRNPSLSAWNMGITLTHFLFCFFLFLSSFSSCFLSGFIFVVPSFFQLSLQVLCQFCIYSLSSITTQIIPAWNTLLIDKSGKKKIFPSFSGTPAHSIVLPASLLPDYAQLQHTQAPQSMAHAML